MVQGTGGQFIPQRKRNRVFCVLWDLHVKTGNLTLILQMWQERCTWNFNHISNQSSGPHFRKLNYVGNRNTTAMYSPKSYTSKALSEKLKDVKPLWMPAANPSLPRQEIRKREERVSFSEKRAVWLGNKIHTPEIIRRSFHEPNRIGLMLRSNGVKDMGLGTPQTWVSILVINYLSPTSVPCQLNGDNNRDHELQSLGQILSNTCFHVTCELRMVSTFSNGWIGFLKYIYSNIWKIYKFKFQCPEIVLSNHTLYLHILYSYFHVKIAKQQKPCGLQTLKYLLCGPSQENFPRTLLQFAKNPVVEN